MSSEVRTCPDCRAPIPADAAAGLCVPCLLKLAQEQEENAPEVPIPASGRKIAQVGDYELLNEIGRGGMGVVYEARQRNLNRRVAVKLILAGEFAGASAVARFQEEAEALASLNHSNVVPIYEIGEDEGWHFYSMKLIEGTNLASRLRASARSKMPERNHRKVDEISGLAKFSPRDWTRIFAKIARAVHAAHQRGIIHRDLSPENILLDQENEPWITDFGLARFVNRDYRLTQTNAIIGKPDYMSPEQADPRGGTPVTTASDIFSLGAILYQALTERAPFTAETPLRTLAKICNEEPIQPSRLNRAVDRDLETICLKCLAKDSSHRYESAAALADDLDRWLRREPILAHPLTAFESSLKWVRRNPLKAAFTLAASLAVLGPLVTTSYLYYIVLPQQARSHPVVGTDPRGLFVIQMDAKRVDRLSMNFDMFEFQKKPRLVQFYFTNTPPEALSFISNLRCQVMADIPGAPDEPRGPVVRPGETFTISSPRWRDRAYFIAPLGWQGQDVLSRAPAAQVCLVLLDSK